MPTKSNKMINAPKQDPNMFLDPKFLELLDWLTCSVCETVVSSKKWNSHHSQCTPKTKETRVVTKREEQEAKRQHVLRRLTKYVYMFLLTHPNQNYNVGQMSQAISQIYAVDVPSAKISNSIFYMMNSASKKYPGLLRPKFGTYMLDPDLIGDYEERIKDYGIQKSAIMSPASTQETRVSEQEVQEVIQQISKKIWNEIGMSRKGHIILTDGNKVYKAIEI